MRVCTKTAACLAVFGLMAFAQSQPSAAKDQSQPNAAKDKTASRLSSDSNFATKAAQGGLAEVQLGNLAKDKASSADVKSFGERMVTDHTKANDELKSIAGKAGITLPTSMDAKSQATYDRLSKLSGAAFDREYMKDMVSDHKTDVNEFKREAAHGTDPELKAFASKTLPTLEEHLKLAETVQAKVK
jgi:putative membrane protein